MILCLCPSKTAYLSVSPTYRNASLPQQELISFKDADRYLIRHQAMQDELKALHRNKTWSLMPFDSSMNVVGIR
jgi:hypothetical protein